MLLGNRDNYDRAEVDLQNQIKQREITVQMLKD